MLTKRSIIFLIVWLINLYSDIIISVHLDDNDSDSSKDESKKSSKNDSDKKGKNPASREKDSDSDDSEENYTCRPLPEGETRTYTPLPAQPVSNPGWFVVTDSEGVGRLQQFVRVSTHPNPVPLDFMSDSVAQNPSRNLPVNPKVGPSAEANLQTEEEAKIAEGSSSNAAGPSSSAEASSSRRSTDSNVRDKEEVASSDSEEDKSEGVSKKGKGKE